MSKQSPPPRSRPRARTASFAFLALGLLAGAASELAAQHPAGGHRVSVGRDRLAGVTTVSPGSGAAGTVVAVRAADLPPGTPVQVMIGGLRSGFEVVAITVTDEEGNLSMEDSLAVTVPDWVRHDRSYLFIVTDRMYNPLASADLFHATDASGGIVREGRVDHLPTACPTLTNDAGELYFLAGNPGPVTPGDEVIVEGRIVEAGACGQGPTIDVSELRRARVR